MANKLAFFRNETAKQLVENMNKNRPKIKETIYTQKPTGSLPHGYFYGRLIEEVGDGAYKARVYAYDNSAELPADHTWVEHPQFIDIDIDVFEINQRTGIDILDLENEEDPVDDLSLIYRFQEIVTYTGHKWMFQDINLGLQYAEITELVDETEVDVNTYYATFFNNPSERVELAVDVTVYANRHTLGIIPPSLEGKGEWVYRASDGKYYIPFYPMFYGAGA